ncbi:MAG: tRNA pseudouridine(13) synthase TruD [Hydrogenovibrio sp.]|uniref:tRNA pseudouridine(13) synthase TruD n=1 Tax=Hydrogenovibrio sp. TaxID=2065821 RepID=UPI0028702645|nr:tRNA pseudouridine(13) synthase TruD [Hydrogenovibrio sp.]MDR9498399.1 tRNA pseudouridine(13) synthase TruD [Hydrogenovibrio sp.]
MTQSVPSSLPDWAYAWSGPVAEAQLKTLPEDFQVTEQLGYELDGDGEHLWLWLEKTGQNTEWVVRELAKLWQLPQKAFGYAGKKDRQAVTRQWVSVHLPGCDDPDWQAVSLPGVLVLEARRHRRKLQTGGLRANRFGLRLRRFCGDRDALAQRLQILAQNGVPNYFGPQRFGHNGQNLAAASDWLAHPKRRLPRHLRGLYLSAMRSAIFNDCLSQRVADERWDQAIVGDVLMTDSGGCFVMEEADEAIMRRVAAGELQPTGLLSGRGRLMTQGEPRHWEEAVMARHPVWQAGLEKTGMKQARRALRLLPEDLRWHWVGDDTLELAFTLPAGTYATTLLRELVQF